MDHRFSSLGAKNRAVRLHLLCVLLVKLADCQSRSGGSGNVLKINVAEVFEVLLPATFVGMLMWGHADSHRLRVVQVGDLGA